MEDINIEKDRSVSLAKNKIRVRALIFPDVMSFESIGHTIRKNKRAIGFRAGKPHFPIVS